jgi:type I restriction enzyme M protein
MEAMILVGNTNKPKNRKGKVLFVNGKYDVIDNKGLAYLTQEHINKLYSTFKEFKDIPHYAKVATVKEILDLEGNMNINFYVKLDKGENEISFDDAYENWKDSGQKLINSMNNLFEVLK